MKCCENSRNSGQIWLNFVENQLKFQQNFANFQKLAYFERFLKISSTFPDVQLALFIDCVDLVKRFAQSWLAVLYQIVASALRAKRERKNWKHERKKTRG